MSRPFDLSVYLVTDPVLNGGRPVEDVVGEALAGGATLVQLRDPLGKGRAMVETARRLAALCRARGAAFVVNDRIDVAIAAEADGVHIGQKDIDARDVRRMIGPDRILGLSVGTPEEFAASRDALGVVDYLGVGPIRATDTKTDAGAAIGVDGVAALAALTELPLVAIGGIDVALTPALVRAGADGVAVVSAIMAAADPGAAARAFAAAVGAGRRA